MDGWADVGLYSLALSYFFVYCVPSGFEVTYVFQISKECTLN